MDDLKKFSAAVLAGIQGGGGPPVAGVSSEANQKFAPLFGSTMVKRAGGIGELAGNVAAEEEAARKAEQQRKLQELEDMTNPDKYEKRRKEDGGFAFYDPTGKEVDIRTFTRRTGVRAADILKDSDNPIDRQYVNDYNNMNDLMQAAFNGENETVQTILKKSGLSADTKPQSYAQELVRRYPHIYGAGDYRTSQSNIGKPVFRWNEEEDDEGPY